MTTLTSSKRNLSIELCKMVASFAVVCLHVEFPGSSNAIASCLCQFANPTFFAITGYFNFRASDSQLRRRLQHILDLYITAWVVHLLYNCVVIELGSGSSIAYLRAAVPDLDEIFRWFAYQQDSFLAQLWFLASTGLCYLVLWGYTRFAEDRAVNYRPLYLMGFSLFTVFFLLDVVLPVTGQTVNFYLFRNGWFFGIPFFLFGLFLHEHQQKICRCFPMGLKGQWGMILGGSLLCLIQLRSGTLRGFPMGTFLVVLGLMLLIISHPAIPWLIPGAQTFVSRCGVYSTGIYLFHITVFMAYQQFLQPAAQSLLGGAEPWLRPLAVWLLSLAVSIVWDWVCLRVKKLLRKKLLFKS